MDGPMVDLWSITSCSFLTFPNLRQCSKIFQLTASKVDSIEIHLKSSSFQRLIVSPAAKSPLQHFAIMVGHEPRAPTVPLRDKWDKIEGMDPAVRKVHREISKRRHLAAISKACLRSKNTAHPSSDTKPMEGALYRFCQTQGGFVLRAKTRAHRCYVILTF